MSETPVDGDVKTPTVPSREVARQQNASMMLGMVPGASAFPTAEKLQMWKDLADAGGSSHLQEKAMAMANLEKAVTALQQNPVLAQRFGGIGPEAAFRLHQETVATSLEYAQKAMLVPYASQMAATVVPASVNAWKNVGGQFAGEGAGSVEAGFKQMSEALSSGNSGLGGLMKKYSARLTPKAIEDQIASVTPP